MERVMTWQGDTELERHIEQSLARSLQDMQMAATAANVGLAEIGRLHRYASDKFAITVATAHHLIEATHCASDLSPHKQAALAHLTQTYLNETLQVTNEMAAAIVDVLLAI